MRTILILFLIFLNLNGFSQVWRMVRDCSKANYSIFFTDSCHEADIVAYTVLGSSRVTRPGLIYFLSGCSKKGIPVCQVFRKEDADVIVCWANRKKNAQWKESAWIKLSNN